MKVGHFFARHFCKNSIVVNVVNRLEIYFNIYNLEKNFSFRIPSYILWLNKNVSIDS